jgi:hypothetical protein
MYPLNMKRPQPLGGFAVANDEAEHASLTAAGYEPPLSAAPQDEVKKQDVSPEGGTSAPEGAAPTIEQLRAALDAKGIHYDKRMGVKRLQELLG